MSSLDPKDAVPDYSGLNDGQRKTLDQWESFFEKVRSGCWCFSPDPNGVLACSDRQRYPLVRSGLTGQRYNIVGKVVP